MATGETGFDDVSYDLISVQYHSLRPGTITGSTSVTPGTPAATTSPRSSSR